MDFFVSVAGRKEGPLSEAEVRERILSGELTPHLLCWTEGWTDRRRLIDTFPDAFNTLAHQTPSPEPPLKPIRKQQAPARPSENRMVRVAVIAIVVSAAVLLAGLLVLR